MRAWILASIVSVCSPACFGQLTKTIECPAGRIYRDVGDHAGREEFCEHVLPGSITVRDGPYRLWINAVVQGAAGVYTDGRKTGKWKECDSNGQCKQEDYPNIYPEERQRPGFKPEVPVSYLNGKYVFDFEACRNTEITHVADGEPDFHLGFAAYPDGCSIGHSPEDGWFWAMLQYNCMVPFQVGKRGLGSLDLINELPKLGLPQYCTRPVNLSGPSALSVSPWIGEGLARVFTAEYDIGGNGVGIAQARLHFQASAASRTDRCVARYDTGTKSLYLLSDEPGKYLGPIAAGGGDSLWNSRCLLSGCSNAQLHGTRLSVRFAIRFNPARFAGPHNMYLEIVDTQKHAGTVVPYYSWSVPTQSASATATWPEDRSCPPPIMPVFSEHCNNVSGRWGDDAGGIWSLAQAQEKISGSYKTATAACGIVAWRVDGEMKDGVGTLRATGPRPPVDGCGTSVAGSITATIIPDCMNGTRVELK
jgi:hypothetical protein